MNQPLTFNTTTFRASSVGNIMTNPKEKSPKEKYESILDEIKSTYAKFKEEYDTIPTDGTPAKIKSQDAKRLKLKEKLNTSILKLCDSATAIYHLLDKIHLSETCISLLLKIYIEQKTGRRDDISNRYLKKGTQAEDNSFTILSDFDDAFYSKNKERYYNEWIQGECDLIEDERITDIKSSWDIFTFQPKTLEVELSKIYWWQGQCYMWLFGKESFRLAYVLSNTPQGIIDDEKKRLLWTLGSNKADSEAYKEGCEEIEHNSIYDDLDVRERVFCLPEIKFDVEKIEELKARVELCRKWLNEYAHNEWARVNDIVEGIEEKSITKKEILELCGLMFFGGDIILKEDFPGTTVSEETLEDKAKDLNEKIYNELSIAFVPDPAFISPKQIDLEDSIAEVKKNLYYIAESDQYYYFTKDEYAKLDERETWVALLTPIHGHIPKCLECDAEVTVNEKGNYNCKMCYYDNRNPDILKDIESCGNQDDLNKLFENLKIDPRNEMIANAFSNKEKELSKNLKKFEILPTEMPNDDGSTTIRHTSVVLTLDSITKDSTEEQCAAAIGLCKSIEDCNTLYPKLKHFKDLVDVLRAKKLKLSTPVPVTAPTPTPAVTKSKPERTNNDLHLILESINASNDILDFYMKNQATIDSDKELRDACEKRGIELERAEEKMKKNV